MQIPKTFHFIWLGPAPMPAGAPRNIARWQQLNPDWKIKLWRDHDVAEMKLENQASYDSLDSYAAKSDILRLEILARHGGVYVDVADFEPIQPIEDLIGEVECFVGWESDGKMMNNAIIGSTPRHGSVLAAIDNLPNHLLTADKRDAAYATGPFYLNKVWFHDARVTKFDSKYLYPYDWHEPWRKSEAFPDAYAVHHWHASWIDETVKPARLIGPADVPVVAVCILGRADRLRSQFLFGALSSQSIRPENIVIHQIDDRCNGAPSPLAGNVILWRDQDIMSALLKVLRWCNQNDVRRLIFIPADHVPDRHCVEHHHSLGASRIGVGLHRMYSSAKLFIPNHKVFPFAVLAAHGKFINMPAEAMTGTARDINELFSVDAHHALDCMVEHGDDVGPYNSDGPDEFDTVWDVVRHFLVESMRLFGGARLVPNWESFSTKLCTHPVMEDCGKPHVVDYCGGVTFIQPPE